jgi:hypothetical protein
MRLKVNLMIICEMIVDLEDVMKESDSVKDYDLKSFIDVGSIPHLT